MARPLLRNKMCVFREGYALKNFVQNGVLAAIIDFNMPDIWQTMPDS